MMNADDPAIAQTIVAEYAAVLEKHDRNNVYPAPLDTLPYPKETIKTAIRTALAALASSGQLTDELLDSLEAAYVATADYIDGELARLLTDYREAGAALASGPRLASEKMMSEPWQVLARSGRLAGEIARAMAEEADALREEFRHLAGAR
jgi:hypothetical protein